MNGFSSYHGPSFWFILVHTAWSLGGAPFLHKIEERVEQAGQVRPELVLRLQTVYTRLDLGQTNGAWRAEQSHLTTTIANAPSVSSQVCSSVDMSFSCLCSQDTSLRTRLSLDTSLSFSLGNRSRTQLTWGRKATSRYAMSPKQHLRSVLCRMMS